MQDHRQDIIRNICALQCVIIKHRYVHTGLDDDRGGHFVCLVLEPLEYAQSNHKDSRGILQGLYAKLLGMPDKDEMLQALRSTGLFKFKIQGNFGR